MDNDFKVKTDYNNQPVTIELEKFIAQGAEEDIVPDNNGESYLKIVEGSGAGSHNHFLKEGKSNEYYIMLFLL